MNNKGLSKVQMTHLKGNALWKNVGNFNNRGYPFKGFEHQKRVWKSVQLSFKNGRFMSLKHTKLF